MRRLTAGLLAGAFGALAFTVALGAAAGTVPEAAMTGDVATVKSLLKSGADVNAALGDGVTGLHWAARQGHEELATTLIVAGSNVQVPSASRDSTANGAGRYSDGTPAIATSTSTRSPAKE